MDNAQLLSFVRYQRGQKQGWDALDEVLTTVTEWEQKVADAKAKVKAEDAKLAGMKSVHDKDMEALTNRLHKIEFDLAKKQADHATKLAKMSRRCAGPA